MQNQTFSVCAVRGTYARTMHLAKTSCRPILLSGGAQEHPEEDVLNIVDMLANRLDESPSRTQPKSSIAEAYKGWIEIKIPRSKFKDDKKKLDPKCAVGNTGSCYNARDNCNRRYKKSGI